MTVRHYTERIREQMEAEIALSETLMPWFTEHRPDMEMGEYMTVLRCILDLLRDGVLVKPE